jgi:hypothetical protein
MATLHTPLEGFTGPGPGGTTFVNGQAETDDPAVIAYARRHGYRVEDEPKKSAGRTPKGD